MAQTSEIQWTDATVNFWTGCKKVSPGCKYCYMYRDKERFHQDPTSVLRTSHKTFYAALKWDEPKLIFTCSWSDFFIEEADQWREDAWDVIRKTPQHKWQILTKRPERVKACLPVDWGSGWDNVWIGVSCENQETADLRIPILLEIPAKTRFLSCEPLLGPIDLFAYINSFIGSNDIPQDKIHWVILGGESGNDTGNYRYRASELIWYEKLIIQCTLVAVPVFMKQLGTHLAKELKLQDRAGGDIAEWGKDIQVREFPNKRQ